MQIRTDTAYFKSISDCATNNNVVGLRLLLAQQETRLNGHSFWSYNTKDDVIEGVARDAILAGHEDILKLFLDAGLSPDARASAYSEDKRYTEPLIYFAAKSGRLNLVKLLVEYGAAVYSTRFYENRNPNAGLKAAVEGGYADIVDYLLACDANASDVCNSPPGKLQPCNTLLGRAAADGNMGIFESLLRYGARVESTLGYIHEKMYVQGYREYEYTIERYYGDRERIDKLDNFIYRVIPYKNTEFRVHLSLTPKAESFLVELNNLLRDATKLKNNRREFNNFLKKLTKDLFTKFKVTIKDKDELEDILTRLLDCLEEFDKKKTALRQKINEEKAKYDRIVRICLDYAMGCDFHAKQYGGYGLTFLADLDVSGMNFIGVSVAGQPVTREMLESEAKSGAKNAIITTFDLLALDDVVRKDALASRLQAVRTKRGKLVTREGIVNVVPLACAAKIGDLAAVQDRIKAGENPNLGYVPSFIKNPLIAAAEANYVDIVKVLFSALSEHTATNANRLIAEAKQFVAHNPSVNCLSVIKGQLLETPLPFISNTCQIIVPGKKRITAIMCMIKRFGMDSLRRAIDEGASYAQATNQNFIMIVKSDGSIEYVAYPNISNSDEKRKVIDKMIKLATGDGYRDYTPVIFTNNGNGFDVIEKLIIAQCEEMDKSKTDIINAIEIARQQKHASIVEFLQERQDINQQDEDGATLLHKAAKDCDIVRVRELLQRDADVNKKNKWGQTPLHVVAEHCAFKPGRPENYTELCAEIVRLLLGRGADPNIYECTSPLELAMKAGNPKVVALLLPVTAKRELIRQDYSSHPIRELRRAPWYVDMMFDALNKNDPITLLTLLRDHGADFNVKSEHGDTLLNEFVCGLPSFSNIKSIMSDLLRSGYGEAHMSDALNETHTDLIKDSEKYFQAELKVLDFLLANGADPCMGGGKNGESPLHLLIEKKDLSHLGKAAEILMNRFVCHGADVNAVDNDGLTPLHRAGSCGDLVAIEYLITQGAEIDFQSKYGSTPLHCAASWGNPMATELLLKLGANCALKNNAGLTPLEASAKAMVDEKKYKKFTSRVAESEFENKYYRCQQLINQYAVKSIAQRRIHILEAGRKTLQVLSASFATREREESRHDTVIVAFQAVLNKIAKALDELRNETEPDALILCKKLNELQADISFTAFEGYYNRYYGETKDSAQAFIDALPCCLDGYGYFAQWNADRQRIFDYFLLAAAGQNNGLEASILPPEERLFLLQVIVLKKLQKLAEAKREEKPSPAYSNSGLFAGKSSSELTSPLTREKLDVSSDRKRIAELWMAYCSKPDSLGIPEDNYNLIVIIEAIMHLSQPVRDNKKQVSTIPAAKM